MKKSVPANNLNPLLPLDRRQITDPSLDGSAGANRAQIAIKQIKANTDLEAIQEFLTEYRHSPATLRSYTKECERLLLWSIHVRGKALSSLSRDDFVAYMAFLDDPQPSELWCGQRASKNSADWRPFVGTLSASGKAATLAATNSMLSWLQDAGYISGNPLGLIRQRRKEFLSKDEQSKGHEPQKVERFLDEEMWSAFVSVIEDMPAETDREISHRVRARFLMAILYFMAPRVSDLERHTMNSFIEQGGRWWWKIIGKGDKAARLPVPDAMIKELMTYRKALGLKPLPLPDDATPLLASLSGQKPITGRRLNQILKELFEQTAQRLEAHAPHKADKVRRASAHWGRHTALTRLAAESGGDRTLVQKIARHSDVRTTELYIHDEDNALHDKIKQRKLG